MRQGTKILLLETLGFLLIHMSVVEYRRLCAILSCNQCIADFFAAELAFEQNVLLCLLDILYDVQCMDQIALKTPNPKCRLFLKISL